MENLTNSGDPKSTRVGQYLSCLEQYKNRVKLENEFDIE